MRLAELLALAVGCVAVTAGARAGSSAELADLVARVDYGFYTGDVRAIEIARDALDRLADAPDVRYYRDYAALRAAQLKPGDRNTLRTCAERTVPTDLPPAAAAEAWVLVAACGVVGQQSARRVEQALARARAIDKRHPRVALVEAWMLHETAAADAAASEGLAAALKQAIEAFDAWRPPANAPDWGEAEALAMLGELMLKRGEPRAARDLIERALLLAPDYRFAVDLRARLLGR